MKKKQLFWVSICLLLSCVSTLNDIDEDDEEHINSTGASLPPLKLVNSFCAFKADDGPCKALIHMYFFNIRTQQCEQFIYGGCEGNQNRFDTLDECKYQCVKGYRESKWTKETPLKERLYFCFLEEDPGICRAFITRYFYNNQSKQCERFDYGGCLGNLNNFESLEECKNSCEIPLNVSEDDASRTQTDAVKNNSLAPQPTKVTKFLEYRGPSFCKTPADRGLCRANETRFYFDFSIKKCRPFLYTGCGGNENNFISKEECTTACKKGFLWKKRKGILIKTKRKKNLPVQVAYEENKD
ncbi:tissue factor pathway inhibitor [Sorex araneus]|uniref:tissue factor pathway inhibitor n=1 Tax=Sorex araneus TaxID=42254 RepID=UPI0024339851|nr:tissue factor pathway inhibitor [Sorex araneus]